MKRSLCWAALVFGIALTGASLAQAAALRMLTEQAPPFSFIRDGEVTGLGVDIVEALASRTATPIRITLLPWSRAYRLAQQDEPMGIFMTTRNAERENLFRWVGPVDTSVTAFYGKGGSGLRIRSLDDARTVARILVPRDWYSHQLLRQLGFTNIHPVDKPEDMARMVLHGRADVMVSANVELPLIAARAGGKASDFEVLQPINKVHDYIAFSRATPPALVQRWQQALDEMKRDGSFARIYAKWLPGEVPPGIGPDQDAAQD